jgi:hypothetical protein
MLGRCLGVLLLLAAGREASACKFEARPFDESLSAADLVFIGRVTVAGPLQGSGLEQQAAYAFDVLHLLRDRATLVKSKTVIVHSPTHSCGVRFRPGETWLVLASGRPPTTSLPASPLLLSDERGIAQRPNVEEVLRRFSREALLDPCLLAQADLWQALDRLPRACKKDADCGALFLDPQPCAAPVVGRSFLAAPDEAKLRPLQKASRDACGKLWERAPACVPAVPPLECRTGRCEVRTP